MKVILSSSVGSAWKQLHQGRLLGLCAVFKPSALLPNFPPPTLPKIVWGWRKGGSSNLFYALHLASDSSNSAVWTIMRELLPFAWASLAPRICAASGNDNSESGH